MTTTVYKNLMLLEGESLQLRDNAFLVVDDGAIVDIGQGWRGAGIDLAQAIVFPAFVDAHTHLADHAIKDGAIGQPTAVAVSPPDGIKYQHLNRLTQDELIAALNRAMRECMGAGIAACGDFREGGVAGVHAIQEAALPLPFRVVAFGDATVPPAEAGYGEQVADVFARADGVGVGDVARFSPSQIEMLATRAGQAAKRLAVHVAETAEAQAECRRLWGESEVMRILPASPDLLVHMTCPMSGDLDAVADSKASVVCCTRTNAILGDGLPPLDALIEREIPFGLGTDNMMFTSPDLFREMDWFSRLVRGASQDAGRVDSQRVLQAATAGGARALGLDDELGCLAPGKAACFVAVDSHSINLSGVRNVHDALVHRAGLQDIVSVVLWGNEVFDRRKR